MWNGKIIIIYWFVSAHAPHKMCWKLKPDGQLKYISLTCSAQGVFLEFLLENDMPKMNWAFICNYKLCVSHLGIQIKLTLVRLHQSRIKPDVPLPPPVPRIEEVKSCFGCGEVQPCFYQHEYSFLFHDYLTFCHETGLTRHSVHSGCC